MRIGFNPNKGEIKETGDFFHQLVIPVYIPNLEGYFKDSFDVLKYCMESVFKTVHKKTYITLVNNGSYSGVTEYLNNLYETGKIHEIINTTNVGKPNAVLKGICGHDFKFITVSDCDVLFLDNWQEESYNVFENFPKTGAVCPTPSSRSLKNHTFNIWFDLLFSKSLCFTKVRNPEALKAFAVSVGNPEMYNEIQLEKYLTVSNNDFKAVVGAGHFVTTYRKEVFEEINVKHYKFKLGGDSLTKLLDFPVVQKGMWRLSTEDNFAYHMGNVKEYWMEKATESLKTSDFFPEKEIDLKKIKSSKILFGLKYKLFSKVIFQKKVWYYCLKLKGLSKKEALIYTQKNG